MSKKYEKISEEDFLKNKAKRKPSSRKTAAAEKKTKTNPVLRGFLIALGVILGIIILIALSAVIYYFAVVNGDAPDHPNKNNDNFINSEGDQVNRLTGEDGSKKYFTFLATATDKGGSLTDVIMVARFHYDDDEPGVSILQIPRDTYVKIATDKLYITKDGAISSENFTSPTAKTTIKINEAFFRGKKLAEDKIYELLEAVSGKNDSEIDKILKQKDYLFIEADPKKVKSYAKANDSQRSALAKEILRDFGLTYLQTLIYYDFGIPIDYNAQVNINGFRGVVNAIGGVDHDVPVRMYYVDEYQDLYIDLYPGQQHLNGAKAEQFVRFRGYPGGDVARLDAQKLFIDAFLDKLLSFSTVTKIDDIITEIQSNLYTDISFNNMLKFANKLLNMDLSSDVHMYTLPGIGEYIGPVSYFVTDRDEMIKLINEEFNVFTSALIDEDFKIVDDESIYRPAVVVTDDTDENVDDEKPSDDENGEDNEIGKEEGEDDKENFGDEDGEQDPEEENTDESEHTSGNEDDDEEGDGNIGNDKDDVDVNITESDTEDNNGDAQSQPGASTEAETGDDSDTANTVNDKDAASGADLEADENYQLLLDMAA